MNKEEEGRRKEYSNLLITFPNAISPSKSHQQIYWLVKVMGISMSMKFFCPQFPSSNGLKVYGECDILAIITEYKELYTKFCSGTETVLQFMHQFQAFLHTLQLNTGYQEKAKDEECEERNLKILSDLGSIGFDKVCHLTDDFSSVDLSCTDERDKVHILKILIPPLYPNQGTPIPQTDIPGDIFMDEGSSFADIYLQWSENLRKFSPALSVLAELDRSCWVIDPDPPTSAHLYRRIALAPNLSIQIEIEPEHPSELPRIICFGPDSKVGPLRAKLLTNSEDWDPEDPIIHNLERILDVEFPSRIEMSREDLKVDCAICFSFNQEGKTPSTVCNNERCSSVFHEDCLYKWLKTLPDTRQTLDTLFGDCTNCKEPIRVHIQM